MLTKIEKLGMILLAIFLAILFFVALSAPESDEKRSCDSFCDLHDSTVRVYESGVCICQK